jgi:hypothetical protein
MTNCEVHFMLSSITAARSRARISITQSKYWCAGRKKEKRKKRKGRRKEDNKNESLEKAAVWIGRH